MRPMEVNFTGLCVCVCMRACVRACVMNWLYFYVYLEGLASLSSVF